MLHPSYTYLRELLLKSEKRPPFTIVDYGCGNGLLIEILEKKNIAKYQGFEVSDTALQAAKEKFDTSATFKFNKINIEKLPSFGKKNSVDQVILIGVLQYLTEKEILHVLSESKKVLRENGQVVISCAVDHNIYKWLNLYQLFITHSYIKRERILKIISDSGLKTIEAQEKGLIIAPFISHCVTIFFDVADRFLLKQKGKIGTFGTFIRNISNPLIWLEYKIPIDYGYTLFLVVKK